MKSNENLADLTTWDTTQQAMLSKYMVEWSIMASGSKPEYTICKTLAPIESLPEQKKNVQVFYSSLLKWKRLMTYCLRFTYNCKTKSENRRKDELSIKELEESLNLLIKLAQKECFPDE